MKLLLSSWADFLLLMGVMVLKISIDVGSGGGGGGGINVSDGGDDTVDVGGAGDVSMGVMVVLVDRGLVGRGEGSGGWGSDGLIGDGGEVTDAPQVVVVEATGGEKTGIVIGSGDRTGVTEGVGVGLESGGIAGGNITTTGDGGEAYGSICGIVGGLVLSIPAGGCDGGRGCEVAAG
uniref:Uncharacterized protein n=1 Tax=Salix viminalis TaxID=40686 RepID=A0A6N2L211_SALVM